MSYLLPASNTFGISVSFRLACQTKWDICKMCGQFQTTLWAQQFLKSVCHYTISAKIKFTRAHIYQSVSSAFYSDHSFLACPPVSLTPCVFFSHLYLLLIYSISWFPPLPLCIFSSCQLLVSSSSLNGYLCLASSQKSDFLMNEMPFHQYATTAVTQNSICCLVCEIPLWIGALSFSLEHLMKAS